MFSFLPKEKSIAELHGYLLAAVAPRPICFASTIDKNGNPNLSPFSFFNVFGSNPPMAIFSPARRVRDNSIKHTLENVYEVKEVVINVVNYDMVQQMSLASTEFEKGVNEFVKSGFTPIPSDIVKPYRVKESPVQLECKVTQVIETGKEGGAGNLIFCEILKIHINENILDANHKIDQNKIDLVARLGADWYVRASGNALFEVEKPVSRKGIGVDQIPEEIRLSHVLSGNNLGQLGNTEKIPNEEELKDFINSGSMDEICKETGFTAGELKYKSHEIAKELLNQNRTEEAWKILLAPASFQS